MTDKIEEIEDLDGVGAVTAEKLSESGVDTLVGLAISTPKNIAEATGMSETKARKLIQQASNVIGMGFKNASDIDNEEEKYFIKTGSSELDKILGGGFQSGIISEIHGQYGSGKTQIVLQLVINTLDKYPDSTVVYLDTENTFSKKRLKQMAEAKGLDFDDVLERIKIAKIQTSDRQIYMSEQISQIIKQGNDVKLIVVDSLTAHFRAEFVGRGMLAERQQKLNQHLNSLGKTADMYNIPVLVTNQVSANPGQFYGDPNQPIGGNIVGHACKYRLKVRRGKSVTVNGNKMSSRVAKLTDSPDMPDAEATYLITSKGIEDL